MAYTNEEEKREQKRLDRYLKLNGMEIGTAFSRKNKHILKSRLESRRVEVARTGILKRNEGLSPNLRLQHKNGQAVKYRANTTDANLVYTYAMFGASSEDICLIMGLEKNWLYSYYKKDLYAGRATANNKIAESIYGIAVGREAFFDEAGNEVRKEMKPNLTALIYLAKVRLGWHEVSIVEQTVGVKPAGVQIYLPDNGMTSIEEGGSVKGNGKVKVKGKNNKLSDVEEVVQVEYEEVKSEGNSQV